MCFTYNPCHREAMRRIGAARERAHIVENAIVNLGLVERLDFLTIFMRIADGQFAAPVLRNHHMNA